MTMTMTTDAGSLRRRAAAAAARASIHCSAFCRKLGVDGWKAVKGQLVQRCEAGRAQSPHLLLGNARKSREEVGGLGRQSPARASTPSGGGRCGADRCRGAARPAPAGLPAGARARSDGRRLDGKQVLEAGLARWVVDTAQVEALPRAARVAARRVLLVVTAGRRDALAARRTAHRHREAERERGNRGQAFGGVHSLERVYNEQRWTLYPRSEAAEVQTTL